MIALLRHVLCRTTPKAPCCCGWLIGMAALAWTAAANAALFLAIDVGDATQPDSSTESLTEFSYTVGPETYTFPARAVNALGQQAQTLGNHAAFVDGPAAFDLGTLGGSFSYAFGINDAGYVVGGSRTVGDASTAGLIWLSPFDPPIPLPVITGGNAFAFDISNGNVIVGHDVEVGFRSSVGWILDGDGFRRVQDDIVGGGWLIYAATNINDLGQILAVGSHDGGASQTTVVLLPLAPLTPYDPRPPLPQPVPEPASAVVWTMLAIGVPVASMARRSRFRMGRLLVGHSNSRH